MLLKKGQKVWVNRARGGIVETTIKTIGRKYITVECLNNTKFYIDTLGEKGYCGTPSYIILDLDKYLKEHELREKALTLHRFDWFKVNDELIEKAYELIKELV